MKTLVITNQKGGVGKTAVACHLAFHLRDAGHRVLFVDLDHQGNASATLKAGESGTTASALFAPDDVTVNQMGKLTLVSADSKLADLDRGDPQIMVTFRDKLRALGAAGDYDFAVIDTGAGLGLRMTAALIAADFVICPIELEGYSIQGITKMLQTVFGVQKKYNPHLTFLGMLPNRFNAHSKAQKQNLDELLESYAHLMIAAKIGNRSSVSEALSQGVPVWEIPKTAARDAAKEMRHAFDLVTDKMENTGDE